MKFLFCPTCGAAIPEAAKFCPGCGLNLNTLKAVNLWRGKHYALLAGISIAVWFGVWSFQSWKAGPKPTESFEQASHRNQKMPSDPKLDHIRDAAKKSPKDLATQQALASELLAKLRETENPPQQLIMDSVEVLRTILELSPNDPQALIALAEISFDEQLFDMSIDYFARYLKSEPEDHNARARYASSLAFTGKFPDAIKELNTVLAKDPKNFHASAYLAITYAQMGDKDKALSAGNKALKLAPSEEAKTRFTQFLNEVKTGATPPSPKAPANTNTTEAGPADLKPLSDSISGNSIAGPKFISLARKDSGVVEIYFHDFPMEGMPPFVKDKFINSIKLKALDLGVKTLVFIDKPSGREMARSDINAK